MNERETDEAMAALIQWFKSQGISPFDGFILMVRLLTKMHSGAMRRLLKEVHHQQH
jgi:hypothetical protein